MNYDAILVPNCKTLRGTTLDILEKFKARGGTVIFTGELPYLEDARPSGRGKALADQCRVVPFSKYQVLNAVKDFRDVEIREKDGKPSGNLFYQMRQEGENRWLFLAHVDRTWQMDDPTVIFGNWGTNLKNEDIPVEEDIKIMIAGEWKPAVYDAMTGDIYPISCTYAGGKTIILQKLFDHASLLLWLEPGKAEEVCKCETGAGACIDGTCDCKSENAEESGCGCKNSADKAEGNPCGEKKVIAIAHEAEIVLSEPNVSVLDLAEYRFDDGEWQAEEEILRIDNIFREKLGYPLRMEAFAQPWTRDKNVPFDHTLSLRYTLYADADIENVSLAMENDETTKILLDGAEVENQASGWYTDRCIRVTTRRKWFGPNAWRTKGAQWSYEYQLRPTGLLKATVITEKK